MLENGVGPRGMRSIVCVEHMTPTRGLQSITIKDMRAAAVFISKHKVERVRQVEGRYIITYSGKLSYRTTRGMYFDKNVQRIVKSRPARVIEVE